MEVGRGGKGLWSSRRERGRREGSGGYIPIIFVTVVPFLVAVEAAAGGILGGGGGLRGAEVAGGAGGRFVQMKSRARSISRLCPGLQR